MAKRRIHDDELHAQFVTFSCYRRRRSLDHPRASSNRHATGDGVRPDTMSRTSLSGCHLVGYFEEVRSSCCKQPRRFCERIESYDKVCCAKIVRATQNVRDTRVFSHHTSRSKTFWKLCLINSVDASNSEASDMNSSTLPLPQCPMPETSRAKLGGESRSA